MTYLIEDRQLPLSLGAADMLKNVVQWGKLCPSDLGVYTYLCIAVDGRLTDLNGHPLHIDRDARSWTGTICELALTGFDNSVSSERIRASVKRLAERGYINFTRDGHQLSVVVNGFDEEVK